VLLLWDRVIGYDSLLPLAVAAAAVIAFRRHPKKPFTKNPTSITLDPESETLDPP
jgi:hypothetical protein